MFILQKHSYQSVADILQDKFLYYQQLNDEDKDKFVRRLLRFIHDKSFEGRQGLAMTEEVEVLVSATAIQLTFGLKEYLLPFFSQVIVYPGIYYSEMGHAYHNGETNSRGAIVFSWKDFAEGLEDPHDRLNLGLHEWAHALMLENQMGFGWDILFREYYNRWRFEAQDEFEALEYHYSEVFREYGGTNIAEFFAVSVEAFFEDPELFREKAPSLFHHLCVLLNQFPLGPEPEKEAEAFSNSLPELQLKAERLDYANFGFIVAAQLVLFILCIQSGELWYLAGVLALVLAGYIFYFMNYSRAQKRSIHIYPERLEIIGRTGQKEAIFDYDNLAGLEIKEKGSRYDISFIFPVKGEVFDSNFSFGFDDKQVAALRKALSQKNLPTKLIELEE